jgi:cysteine synthase A
MKLNNTLIGNTPLINIDGIWCKCEYMNLTGSIKDRIAYEMLSNVNRKKYSHVLEVTSGNTGISIAAISGWFGLKATIICPTSTSEKKQILMSKYGATIINVDGNISDCMKLAKEGCKNYNYFFLNQFENIYNTKAQIKMALEIAVQLSQQEPTNRFIDTIVTGIGTGGTLAGLYYRFPNAKFYTWVCDKLIEGTSDGVTLPLKPKECNLIQIPIDYDNVIHAQEYLAHNGIFVGLSSAANFSVAKKLKHLFPNKNILTILVDNGIRYL